ncbi:hypothetical protein LGK97_06705 [Clostridium sp. CS001]|uniref:hypothetical protein n=1 Tax=Clostridium sp. CS001 TaxID=2880648 RepID=UPI001CF43A37|nr:hypothetical protein [Clostridium sp. CS001]MCB2289456.1 hypothetical protein [Clostridium sp. CS001]
MDKNALLLISDKFKDLTGYIGNLLFDIKKGCFILVGIISILVQILSGLNLDKYKLYSFATIFIFLWILFKFIFEYTLDKFSKANPIQYGILFLLLVALVSFGELFSFTLSALSSVSIHLQQFTNENAIIAINSTIPLFGFIKKIYLPLCIFSYKKYTNKTIKALIYALSFSLLTNGVLLFYYPGILPIFVAKLTACAILFFKYKKLKLWKEKTINTINYRYLINRNGTIDQIYKIGFDRNLFYIKKYNKVGISNEWKRIESALNENQCLSLQIIGNKKRSQKRTNLEQQYNSVKYRFTFISGILLTLSIVFNNRALTLYNNKSTIIDAIAVASIGNLFWIMGFYLIGTLAYIAISSIKNKKYDKYILIFMLIPWIIACSYYLLKGTTLFIIATVIIGLVLIYMKYDSEYKMKHV